MLLLIQYTIIFAAILSLVALGGCFSEHSGVINLGLEGIMVIGAMGGAMMMRYLPEGTPAMVIVLAVILIAMLAGVIYSCLLAVSAIHCKADQTIIGTAMNLLGTAMATVIVKSINLAVNPDDQLVHRCRGDCPDRILCVSVQDPLRSAAVCMR